MKQSIVFILLFALAQVGLGQESLIASQQLYPKSNEIGLPIIALNQQQPLVLEFDYLGDDAPYFSYKIEHYSANWQKSNISALQSMKGFNTGSINDFEFSLNTRQLYTHYEFEFPNQQLEFKVSGNYKITVTNDTSGKEVFSMPFYVTEQIVNISGAIKNASGLGQLESHHNIQFLVNYQGLAANNPRQEFQANIYQNTRPDNAIIDIKPLKFDDETLYFTNPFQQSIGAGNEFRWFNIKSTNYLREKIADVIVRKDSSTHVYLIPDLARQKQEFIVQNDFNGQFVIDHQEGTRPDIDAEYVYVHFTLKETPELKDKDIYVYGELTDWKLKDEYKLEMNPRQNLLEATLLLKQGNYDYMYVVKDKNKELTSSLTEGNFYRTQNDYNIFIYYKPMGGRYDRLVGYQKLDSRFN